MIVQEALSPRLVQTDQKSRTETQETGGTGEPVCGRAEHVKYKADEG